VAGAHNRKVSCQIDIVTLSNDIYQNETVIQDGATFHGTQVGTILDYMLASDVVASLNAQAVDGLQIQIVDLETESILAGDMRYETSLTFSIYGGPV
jgi:hypothetical protein